jgi:hypothetical protein
MDETIDKTIDDLFPTTPAAVRTILVQVRRLVRDALPEAPKSSIMGHWPMSWLRRDPR